MRVCAFVCVRGLKSVCACSFLEGIDLSVFHSKVLKVQSMLMALTLCSPERLNIDVSLSNQLFRNKSEKKKKGQKCTTKDASHQNANTLAEWKEFYLNGFERIDRDIAQYTLKHISFHFE